MYSIWLQSLRKNWIILWSAWKRAKLCLESQRLFHHSAGTSITGLPVSSTLYAYVIHLRFLSYKGEALSVDYRLSTAMQIYLCAMLFLSIVLFSHFGCYFNPLMGTGNYSAHRIIWSWYTGRWWVDCYRPLLAVPNVTVHPSTASVPTSYYSMCTIIPCAH